MDTNELLAVKLPHLPADWLKRYNTMIGSLKQDPINRGTVEECTRWNKGQPSWTDWKQRDSFHPGS